uniref:Uncharacterized protein n=1 Tax=Romanomermis culicivorax TaxID=13658 RepID=A0A915JT15_ROMCU
MDLLLNLKPIKPIIGAYLIGQRQTGVEPQEPKIYLSKVVETLGPGFRELHEVPEKFSDPDSLECRKTNLFMTDFMI